jgi:hypothetical protein
VRRDERKEKIERIMMGAGRMAGWLVVNGRMK